MDEYNNSVEELLKDFEELQIREIVKQVNTNTGAPTGSVGSNFVNPDNYERGEPSNPTRNSNPPLSGIYSQNARGLPQRKRRTTVPDEF